MHLGGGAHMYTKYEVSVSNPVPKEVCTDADANDGQSMIVEGSLVDKPNEPKNVLLHSVLNDIYLLLACPLM